MPTYLPAGFKVLTDELTTTATKLHNASQHLSTVTGALGKQVAKVNAVTDMEDGKYGPSRPGQAFDDYWKTMAPRLSTLAGDIEAVSKALDGAAKAYEQAERHSTAAPGSKQPKSPPSSKKAPAPASPPKSPTHATPTPR